MRRFLPFPQFSFFVVLLLLLTCACEDGKKKPPEDLLADTSADGPSDTSDDASDMSEDLSSDISSDTGTSDDPSEDVAIQPTPDPTTDTPLLFSGHFALVQNPADKRSLLAIKKEALAQKYRYLPAFYSQVGFWLEPMYLAAKEVRLEQRGSQLFLEELDEYYYAEVSFPHTTIIDSFPILMESDDAIAVDVFPASGQLYLPGAFSSATDFECVEDACAPDTTQYAVADIEDGYIEDISTDGTSFRARIAAEISIRDVFALAFEPTVVLDLHLTPLVANKKFTSKESNFQRSVGFFETPGLPQGIGNGLPRYNILKYDLEKPIHYLISANTPEKLRPAIEEGVLYWNKALGKNLISVSVATKAEEGNPFDANLIQWVDAEAPYAFAHGQADPKTGELFHTGVFLPNWTQLFSNYLVVAPGAAVGSTPAAAQQLHLRTGLFCSMPIPTREDLYGILISSAFAESAVQSEEPKALNERLVADFYRAIVAHEVGHTLGLRHNFAGSLGSNIDVDEYIAGNAHYLNDGSVEAGHEPATSVMDYMTLSETAWLGRIIKDRVLSYDRAAVQWGYFDKSIAELDVPVFCTDGFAGNVYVDCLPFDSTSAPQRFNSLERVFGPAYSQGPASEILGAFVAAKAPPPNQRSLSVERVLLYPEARIAAIEEAIAIYEGDLSVSMGFGSYDASTAADILRRIAVEMDFPAEKNTHILSELEGASILDATTAYVAEGLETAGGLSKTLFSAIDPTGDAPPEPHFLAASRAAFLDLLESENAKSGTTLYGSAYAFSTQEISTIRKKGLAYFDYLTKHGVEALLVGMLASAAPSTAYQLLENSPDFRAADFSESTAIVIRAAQAYIMASSDSAEFVIYPSEEAILLPRYTYSATARVAAAELLAVQHGDETLLMEAAENLSAELLDRFEENKAAILDVVDALIAEEAMPEIQGYERDDLSPGEFPALVLEHLPAELARLIVDDQGVLESLDAAASGSASSCWDCF